MGDPAQGFHLLMLRKLGLPPELHSPSLSATAPLSCPTEYEMPFEFR
jgi:hypothetical protein